MDLVNKKKLKEQKKNKNQLHIRRTRIRFDNSIREKNWRVPKKKYKKVFKTNRLPTDWASGGSDRINRDAISIGKYTKVRTL